MPAIYASEARTVQLGRYHYGMPKQLAETDVRIGSGRFDGTLAEGTRRSVVHARLRGGGRVLGAVISRLWPRWTWPVHFPSGGQVRALILATPRVQVASIRAGHLALQTTWLPRARPFLPVGLYVRGLRMHLPPSDGRALLHAAARRRPC
jgi:hypothetical protein